MSIEKAKEKILTEAAAANSPIAKMLSRQICENITDMARAEKVLDESKTLAGCKKGLDDFARKNKSGSESVVTPDAAQRIIAEYFGFEAEPVKPKIKVVDIFDLI